MIATLNRYKKFKRKHLPIIIDKKFFLLRIKQRQLVLSNHFKMQFYCFLYEYTNLWILQETQFELRIKLKIFVAAPYSGYDYHSPFLSLEFFNRTNLHICDVSLVKQSPYFLNLKLSNMQM